MAGLEYSDSLGPQSCEHGPQEGCVYCPICGVRHASLPRKRSLLSKLFAPIAWIARSYMTISATPDMDVGTNLEAIRSQDPKRMRTALGYLLQLAPHARGARAEIEALMQHEDRDIALRARDLVAAIDAR